MPQPPKKTSNSNDQVESEASKERKRQIIQIVRQYHCLWDLSDQNHSNKTVIGAAWDAVALATGEPARVCKKVWRALRNSWKYHKNKIGVLKSGKSGEESDESVQEPRIEEAASAWIFWNDMAFLLDVNKMRTTVTIGGNISEDEFGHGEDGSQILTINTEDSEMVLSPADLDGSVSSVTLLSPSSASCSSVSVSNYGYASQGTKRKQDHGEIMAKTITEYVNSKKMKSESGTTKSFKYYHMLAHLDSMWSKLPDHKVQELYFKIHELSYQAMQDSNYTVTFVNESTLDQI